LFYFVNGCFEIKKAARAYVDAGAAEEVFLLFPKNFKSNRGNHYHDAIEDADDDDMLRMWFRSENISSGGDDRER